MFYSRCISCCRAIHSNFSTMSLSLSCHCFKYKSLHQLKMAMHHHPLNQEFSIYQSSQCLVLVMFPMLSSNKPQAPLLVVPFHQFFKFQLCNHTSPRTQKLWFPRSCPLSHERNFGRLLAGIVYG